jgi:hypothetical protein
MAIWSDSIIRAFALVPLLIAVIGDISPTFGQSKEAAKLNELLGTLEDHYNRRDNFLIKWRFEEFDSAEYVRASVSRENEALPKGSQKSSAAVKEQYVRASAELAMKNGKVWTQFEITEVRDGKEIVIPHVHVFNGEIVVLNRNVPNEFHVSRDRKNVKGCMDPWDLCGESYLRSTLSEVGKHYELVEKVLVKDLPLAGQTPRLHLEILGKPGTLGVVKATLRRDLGFSVEKLELYNAQGRLMHRWHNCEYQIVDGEVYPKSATETVYVPDASNATPLRTLIERKVRVEPVVSQADLISDSLFQVSIPVTAHLWDIDTNVWVRRPEEVQAHLDTMLSEVGAHRPGRLLTIVVSTVIALLGLTLIGWYLARKMTTANRG